MINTNRKKTKIILRDYKIDKGARITFQKKKNPRKHAYLAKPILRWRGKLVQSRLIIESARNSPIPADDFFFPIFSTTTSRKKYKWFWFIILVISFATNVFFSHSALSLNLNVNTLLTINENPDDVYIKAFRYPLFLRSSRLQLSLGLRMSARASTKKKRKEHVDVVIH